MLIALIDRIFGASNGKNTLGSESARVVQEAFSGTGTVLFMRATNLGLLSEKTAPHDLVHLLANEHSKSLKMILESKGVVAYHVGGEIMAYWQRENFDGMEAQLAFSTALKIFNSYTESLGIKIVLGSGLLFGDFFAPKRQFQIRGAAVSLSEKIMEFVRGAGERRKVLMLSEPTVASLKIIESKIRLMGNVGGNVQVFEFVDPEK